MARSDPLMPNAGIVARREYRDRTRSPLFLGSTVLLAILAMLVALAPIGIRYMDRQTVTRIGVVSSDPDLGQRSVTIADQLLNVPPGGVADPAWERPYAVEIVPGEDRALAMLHSGDIGGFLVVERLPSGQVDIQYRTLEGPNSARSQILGVASFGIGVLDWSSRLPPGEKVPFVAPSYQVDSITTATDGKKPLDAQQAASRSFLGIIFVVLLFITIVIYGMWVATGVAAEKSSRVMELMISAASPRQMLTGKVVGIGAAGLTQYVAIALPALILILFQDRIAEAILGPDWASGAPLVGHGVFFLLGFTLFALIYAAMGSFVSRPDDLQTLSLPLSLVAMVGYLTAIVALGGGGGSWVTVASYLPPFSPFVMLARIMVTGVEPWQVLLSIGLMIAAIAVVAVVATRMYAAGVLLYGTRPGIRAFVAAARKA
jgi:ABC-2 type transport system permease protein